MWFGIAPFKICNLNTITTVRDKYQVHWFAVLLPLLVQVARTCLGSRQLQYQPIGQGNFAKTFNRTWRTIGRPALYLLSQIWTAPIKSSNQVFLWLRQEKYGRQVEVPVMVQSLQMLLFKWIQLFKLLPYSAIFGLAWLQKSSFGSWPIMIYRTARISCLSARFPCQLSKK